MARQGLRIKKSSALRFKKTPIYSFIAGGSSWKGEPLAGSLPQMSNRMFAT
jgi:hypothetical protein